jgi:hypothetical protein
MWLAPAERREEGLSIRSVSGSNPGRLTKSRSCGAARLAGAKNFSPASAV